MRAALVLALLAAAAVSTAAAQGASAEARARAKEALTEKARGLSDENRDRILAMLENIADPENHEILNGGLLVVDPLPEFKERRATVAPDVTRCLAIANAIWAAANGGAARPANVNGIPQLSSRPGAPNRVFLDFDGHVLSGVAWFSGTKTALPYRGLALPLSAAIGDTIIQTWCMMAEDFAAYNIDVTTVNSVQSGLVYGSGSRDARLGHVLFTPKNAQDGTALYVCSCGGVAYLNVFSGSSYAFYSPAFVFNDGDYNGVGEAGSHEFGHNLGLNHDATNADPSYYQGANGFAAIMGVGYYQNIVQWSKGDYPDANNFQDDTAILRQLLSSASDETNQVAPACTAFTSSPTTTFGLINDPALHNGRDRDVFCFSGFTATELLITVEPRTPSGASNVKLGLEVQVDGGQPMANYLACQATTLSASLRVTLPSTGSVVTVTVLPSAPSNGLFPNYANTGFYQLRVEQRSDIVPATCGPCDSSPCQNGGTCTNSPDGQSFTCTCTALFAGTTCNACRPGTNCCLATSDCNDGNQCTTDSCVSNQCTATAIPNCCTTVSQCTTTLACRTPSCVSNQCRFDLTPDCCGNGVCDATESCTTCAADCTGASRGRCGDGICQADPVTAETCRNCPADCAGVTTGSPSKQYCCGDATTRCSNTNCRASTGRCILTLPFPTWCCGDNRCDLGEVCTKETCTTTTTTRAPCLGTNAVCTSNAACCSNSCRKVQGTFRCAAAASAGEVPEASTGSSASSPAMIAGVVAVAGAVVVAVAVVAVMRRRSRAAARVDPVYQYSAETDDVSPVADQATAADGMMY